MNRIPEYLTVAGIALPLALVAACAQVSLVVSAATADAPEVASALETIRDNLVPAAEATANMLAKGAAATIQSAVTNYVTPACAAAKTSASAVDSGWLANVVAGLVTTAANGQVSAVAPPSGGN